MKILAILFLKITTHSHSQKKTAMRCMQLNFGFTQWCVSPYPQRGRQLYYATCDPRFLRLLKLCKLGEKGDNLPIPAHSQPLSAPQHLHVESRPPPPTHLSPHLPRHPHLTCRPQCPHEPLMTLSRLPRPTSEAKHGHAKLRSKT